MKEIPTTVDDNVSPANVTDDEEADQVPSELLGDDDASHVISEERDPLNSLSTSSSPSSSSSSVPLFPVFIPSRGRWKNTRGTVAMLMISAIPFTIVVEPHEAKLYQELLTSLRGASSLKDDIGYVAILPMSNQGVSYVRNYILDHLAPKHNWFWMMDDDIQGFLQSKNRVNAPISALDMQREVVSRMKMHPNAALFSLDYPFYAWQYGDDAVAINSYNNIATLMNLDNIPPEVRYRFRIREDYDFTLQLILHGKHTIRFRNLSYKVPRMAVAPGGMTDYYEQNKTHIVLQNKEFIDMWPSVSREVIKGTGDQERLDMSVKWMLLNPSRCKDPSAILRSKERLNLPPPPRKAQHRSEDQESDDVANSPLPAVATGRKSRSERKPVATKKRRRCDDSDEEDNTDDEDDDDDLLAWSGSDEEDVTQLPRQKSGNAVPRRPSPQPKKEKEKTLPGWKGYALEKYRDIADAATAERAGLILMASSEVKVGRVVVIVPFSLDLPAAVEACILEVTRRPAPLPWQWTAVIEGHRSAPIQTVEKCYRLAEGCDLAGAAQALEAELEVNGGETEADDAANTID